MERWAGKIAVVTGASSGIGAAIAIALAKANMIVVGLARRPNLIDQLSESLPNEVKSNLYSVKCNLADESDIKSAFKWIDEKFGSVDVLVNNAGVALSGNIVDCDNSDMLRQVIDINVLAVAVCTREAFQIMNRNKVDGHIIHINSVDGHHVPYLIGKNISYNLYSPSKFAITAMTEVLRQELQLYNTKIKVTVIYLSFLYCYLYALFFFYRY